MPLILLNNELEPIREDYCSWEVSELLKKIGFNMTGIINIYTSLCYSHDNTLELIHSYNANTVTGYTLAPTHAYACKWLRINFGVYCSMYISSVQAYWCTVKAKWDGQEFCWVSVRGCYATPALAMEDALLYILKEL